MNHFDKYDILYRECEQRNRSQILAVIRLFGLPVRLIHVWFIKLFGTMESYFNLTLFPSCPSALKPHNNLPANLQQMAS